MCFVLLLFVCQAARIDMMMMTMLMMIEFPYLGPKNDLTRQIFKQLVWVKQQTSVIVSLNKFCVM